MQKSNILYISHKLDEIKALCHSATILRNGKRVDVVKVADESTGSLAAKMMGEALEAVEPRASHNIGDVRLSVSNLNLAAADEFGIPLKQINLDVRSGEIVGIAGVAGNGQDELLMAQSMWPNGKQQPAQTITNSRHHADVQSRYGD